MNVVSFWGGKVHLPTFGEEEPFPRCRTGGMDSGGTAYKETNEPLSCKVCMMYESKEN